MVSWSTCCMVSAGGQTPPDTHHPEAVPQVGTRVLEEGPAGGAPAGALLSFFHGLAVATHLERQSPDSVLLPGPPSSWAARAGALVFRGNDQPPRPGTLSPEYACPQPLSTLSAPGMQEPTGGGAGAPAHLPGQGELLQAVGHCSVRQCPLIGRLIVIGAQKASRHPCCKGAMGESVLSQVPGLPRSPPLMPTPPLGL